VLAAVLVAQAAVTWALVGLIWTIQLVHYPLLAGIATDRYPRWQRLHMTRITWVVGPLMIIEGATAAMMALLVWRGGPRELLSWALGGGLLLVLIWLSTALLQAPAHGRLTAGFDPALHRWLMRTNWLRTLLWSARGGLLLLLLLRVVQGRLPV
jgi:hypothetical protein